MKRWIVLLVLLVGSGISAGVAVAQEETFNWEPYNFTIALPDTWTALEDGDRLVIGEPGDVDLVTAGATPAGLTLTVHIVPGPLAPDFPADYEFKQLVDSGWTTSTGEGNGLTLHVAEIPALAKGRAGYLVFIEPNYLITAIAPGEQWDQSSQALLDTLFASIWVSPAPLPRDTELTQRFTWRDISLSTPRDWFLSSAGNKYQAILISQANHLYVGTTFQTVELTVSIRDLSYLRPLLNADSLLDFETFGYRPDSRPLSGIVTFDLNGIDAASVDLLDDDGVTAEGKAVLLLTPRHAYLVVGFADPGPWAESESDLFEAILKTVEME